MAEVPETQEQLSGRLFVRQPLAHTVGMDGRSNARSGLMAGRRYG